MWQQHRAHSWQSEHRTWQQRGGYNGYRIPDDRFRGYFGPGHGFRIYSFPLVVVGGYPRFQYGGFWFSFLTRGQNTGQTTGTTTMMCMSTIPGTAITCTTVRYPQDRIAISVLLN